MALKSSSSAGLSWPVLGELDKAGGKLTDKDRRPLTSTLFFVVCSGAGTWAEYRICPPAMEPVGA